MISPFQVSIIYFETYNLNNIYTISNSTKLTVFFFTLFELALFLHYYNIYTNSCSTIFTLTFNDLNGPKV